MQNLTDTSLRVFHEVVSPTLTKRQQAVFNIFSTGDYSMREVANILHVPEHTISGRGGELVKLGKLFKIRMQKNPSGNSERVLSKECKLF